MSRVEPSAPSPNSSPQSSSEQGASGQGRARQVTFGPPPLPRTAEDITELFRGAITSGQLGDGERLPTVRQTARDFGVAIATAAKAYRALEQDGLTVTRTAAGTRVAPGASRAPQQVVERARELVAAAEAAGLTADDTAAVLRALFTPQP